MGNNHVQGPLQKKYPFNKNHSMTLPSLLFLNVRDTTGTMTGSVHSDDCICVHVSTCMQARLHTHTHTHTQTWHVVFYKVLCPWFVVVPAKRHTRILLTCGTWLVFLYFFWKIGDPFPILSPKHGKFYIVFIGLCNSQKALPMIEYL